MKDFIESIGGFLVGVIVLIGMAFLAGIFLKGGVWLSIKILPLIAIVAWIVFALNLFIVLPLGIFDKTKAISAFGLVISSYIFGLYIFCWSMLLAYLFWGVTGLVIGLFIAGVGVVPVAMLAVTVNGEWLVLVQLFIMAIVTYGSRVLGFYFADKADDIAYEKKLETEAYL
jgi:hypothetical protein